MFGCTKSTSEITAVARTPPCKYHLGLGIYNVQVTVEGMDGNKKNHLLHLCGQLLRLVLIPCDIEGGAQTWTRTVKLCDICGEMNPLVFSALEEVNWFFTLMVRSSVMVDSVFARFMFCTFYWR